MRELVTIVIPVFYLARHPLELALLERARKEFTEFSFVFICPEGMDSRSLTDLFPESTVYRFDPAFFANQKEYTKLLLRDEFYDLFGWSEFILLFEPNSYVVKNELHYWCKQGHDYISDANGQLSLRNVDRFLSLTRKGRNDIARFLSADAHSRDNLYWRKKSRGIFPSLRCPSEIVSDYFSLPVSERLTQLKVSELPFAITGIDPLSEEHRRWIEALEER